MRRILLFAAAVILLVGQANELKAEEYRIVCPTEIQVEPAGGYTVHVGPYDPTDRLSFGQDAWRVERTMIQLLNTSTLVRTDGTLVCVYRGQLGPNPGHALTTSLSNGMPPNFNCTALAGGFDCDDDLTFQPSEGSSRPALQIPGGSVIQPPPQRTPQAPGGLGRNSPRIRTP